MKKAKASSSSASSRTRDKQRALQKQLAAAKRSIEQARKEARLRKSDAAKLRKVTEELGRTKEALKQSFERQTATAEILKVISSSPTDIQPVLDAVCNSAARLCEANDVLIRRLEGDVLRAVAHMGPIPLPEEVLAPPLSPGHMAGRAVIERRTIHIHDVTDPEVLKEYPAALSRAQKGTGFKSLLIVPLIRHDKGIGLIAIRRVERRPFSDQQITLLQSFADQAVIAIENVRLFNETKESLERQTAISEILRVISNSPGDVRPVLQAVAERAARICEAQFVDIVLAEGDTMRVRSSVGDTGRPIGEAIPLDRSTVMGRSIVDRKPVHVADLRSAGDEFPLGRRLAMRFGHRTILAVPLLREDRALGTIIVRRNEVRPIEDKHVSLLQTFADQAALAIENARLFTETKESLERQTATSEVLKAISRTAFDLNAVLQVLIENATRLAGANQGFIFRYDGETARLAYSYNAPQAYRELNETVQFRPGRGGLVSRTLLERRPVHIADALADPEFTLHEMQRAGGFRSMLGIPMMRDGNLIGVIAMWTTDVRPFTEKQMELVSTFADQAVIAIENVRLFNETKEALERQTATAEILKAIASSPTDVQPVFDVIVERAVKLCGARFGRVYRYDGSIVQMVAGHGLSTAGLGQVQRVFPRPAADDTIVGRVILARQPYFVQDIQRDTTVPILSRQMIEALDTRSQLTVPMLRAGEPIGAITMGWDLPDGFDDRKVALLQTFADQAVIAIENVRLFNETKEALERQTATSEILRVIASSPSDVQPVFDAIVTSGARLFARRAVLRLAEDGELRRRALSDPAPGTLQGAEAIPIDLDSLAGRVFLEGRPQQVLDTLAPDAPPFAQKHARTWNFRANAGAPLLRDGKAIGIISVNSPEPGAMSDKQMELLQTFADQAVIAIQNVHLFNETKEALERQTATAEVLKVISRSFTDTQPVFDIIAERAARLTGASYGWVFTFDGEWIHAASSFGLNSQAIEAARKAFPMRPSGGSYTARAIRDAEVVNVADALAETDPEYATKSVAAAAGYRSVLSVPMFRDRQVIGAIVVNRAQPGRFADKEVELLKTFADQAVIAIENVRLFNETKEALERQTATAEILKVIGASLTDTQPVFDAIVKNCRSLFRGSGVVLRLLENDILTARAGVGTALAAVPLDGQSAPGACVLEGRIVHLPDLETAAERYPLVRQMGLRMGFRSGLYAPLLREGRAIGTLTVLRPEVGSFSDKDVALLTTFADQAVIAIENVRLFNETKEALDQQTATAGILGVISSSPTSVEPVFESILEHALRLCEASFGYVCTSDGNAFDLAVQQGLEGEVLDAALKAFHETRVPGPGTALGRLRATREAVHILDASAEPAYSARDPRRVAIVEVGGARTMLAMPLSKDGAVIGAVVIYRREVRAFTEKQIDLLRTFAAQAVIAIENVRLFNETKESLERQTATAEILKVIASSPSDVQPVFDAIVNSVSRLFGRKAALRTVEPEGLRRRARSYEPTPGEFHGPEVEPLDSSAIVGQAILGGRALQWRDTLVEGAATYGMEKAKSLSFRSIASAPLLKDGKAVGVISVSSPEPGLLSDKQMELLSTFADQAVIAIQNVRLFNETKEALERQTATAEILKVIASSPSDVQPVFDAIVQSAVRLFEPCNAGLWMVEGDQLFHRALAKSTKTPTPIDTAALGRLFPRPLARSYTFGIAIAKQRVVELQETEVPGAPPEVLEISRALGTRSVAFVPLVREGSAIGVIALASPTPGLKLTPEQTELLKTFADQAVIAIENVRLFNETRESLERQTATAEILNVIASSPSDVQPVFDAIAASARRLLGGHAALVARRAGDVLELAAFTSTGDAGDFEISRLWPSKIAGKGHMGKALLSAAPAWLEDIETDTSYSEEFRVGARARGMRSAVSVPMLREGEAIGVISVNRSIPGRFSDHQTNLLRTFADQAVIAIENVRLFNETQEALARQEAAAQVLRSISESVSDTAPVFTAILDCCNRLIPSIDYVQVQLIEGPDRVRLVDHRFGQVRGAAPGKQDERRAELMAREAVHFPRPLAGSTLERALNQGRVVILADTLDGPDTPPGTLVEARRWGHSYSQITVPLMREGRCIGAIEAFRRQLGGFEAKESSLLESFADQAVIAIENVRLFNETKESLERQTATAEILKVIASSPSDVQPVLEAVASSAARLCEANDVVIVLKEGDNLRYVVHHGDIPTGAPLGEVKRISPDWTTGRAALERRQIYIRDVLDETEALGEGARMGTHAGYRTVLATPLLREGAVLGVITMRRHEVQPFEPRQIELINTFSDQAVIAIENVRLFNETRESLERQTATAEILNVISRSPTDAQPVFDAILGSALRLTEGETGALFVLEGTQVHVAAARGTAGDTRHRFQRDYPAPLTYNAPAVTAIREGCVQNVADTWESGFEQAVTERARTGEYRSALCVPMLRDGKAIGSIAVVRRQAGLFGEKHVAQFKTFADQAVIAIENVRLFNETKEALERQTATAEILKVISSSPTDAQPVFEAIVDSCARLFDGLDVGLNIVQGEVFDRVAVSDRARASEGADLFPMPLDRSSIAGRAMLGNEIIQIEDLAAEEWILEGPRRHNASRGFRSALCAPMSRDGKAIGAIMLFRGVTGQFKDEQVALLQTFADQAVIAIENVRLFKELEERTSALGKSVEKLTALGEVGQAISSTLDLEKVLKTIATHAVQLSGLDGASIYEYDEASEEFRLQVADSFPQEFLHSIRNAPIRRGDGTVGRVAITLEPIQVPDIQDPGYRSSRKELLVAAGYRAILTVPLLREGRIIGALNVTRKAPGPFAQETVELLKTFATQSAMAIQNARLFREIAEKGKQLEEASRHKSQFLASMSHELRTPLNAILGFNEMILGDIYGEVPADMKEPLTDIQTSGKHLLRLINNVLDLAKIEAGRMELALDDYSVHDTVESVRSTLRPLAEAKGLELAVTVPPDIPLARGDGGRITQCLMNLAGNSLKFTKQGRVGISVVLNNGTLTYQVKDTGIGIAPDKIGSLFTEFKQTDATIASEYGGTGLGLSITKKFIEMHGGRIWAESEPGSGSTFIFEVPLRTGEGGGT